MEKTYEEWLEQIEQNGWALFYVPDELKTPEICKIAVEQDWEALEDVPEALKTPEICKIAVKKNGWALHYVPKELKEEIKKQLTVE